jgi:hypothetical protein
MMIQASQVARDSIRQAVREVFADPAYQWERPRSISSLLGEWFRRVQEVFERLQESHPLAYYVVLGLLTGLLIAILAHFAYLVWRVIGARPKSPATAVLKRKSPHGAQWYMDESRRLMSEGQFAEALASRFRALLLNLDRLQVIRFHPSKTPAEYLPEIRLDDNERSVFGGLIGELYGHLFGGVPCSQTEVRRFDEIATDLESHAPAR